MLIQTVTNDPDKVFVVVRNDSAAEIGNGYPCVFKFDGTRDGLDVEDAKTGAAAKNHLIAGIVDTDLPASQYGLAQCYGVRTDAAMLKAGSKSNKNAAIGDILVLHTAQSLLSGVAAGAVSGFFAGIIMGETMASSSATVTTTGTVFLRLM